MDKSNQQIGHMKHSKRHIIKPHRHKRRNTNIFYTTEVIILFKGLLRVDFYDDKQKYLFSKTIKEKDIIMLIHGGHGFKILKKTEMIEIKQGPYSFVKDKIKSKMFFVSAKNKSGLKGLCDNITEYLRN